MADQKNNHLLTIAVLGGLGYLVYYMWQKNQLAAGAATPTAGPVYSPANGLPPTTGITTPGMVTVSVPSQTLPVPTIQPTPPNGIDPTVYSVVQSWAQDDGRAPVLAMAAAVIPAEYAGMYDIITNYWDKNVSPIPPAQTQFWNALRTKYDPQHLLW